MGDGAVDGLTTGYGDGDGYGFSYGLGDGCGYGDGYGNSNGYGSGDGCGDGDIWQKAYLSQFEHRCPKNAVLAFWRSAADGRPANGGKGPPRRVGMTEIAEGPLRICTRHALHGTLLPWAWRGERLWVVALFEPIVQAENKLASLKRKIIADVTEEFW